MSAFDISGPITAFDAPMVSSESTCEITLDDLNEYARQLPGMRLTLEHMHPMHESANGREITVGKLTKAEVDAGNVCLRVEAAIDGDKKGMLVRQRIKDHLLKGFSVGLCNELDLNTGKHRKRLVEVSITAEPEVPTAIIDNVRETRAYSSRKMDTETRAKVDELIGQVTELAEPSTTIRIISASSQTTPEKTKQETQERVEEKTQEKKQTQMSDAFERGFLAGQKKEEMAAQSAIAGGRTATAQPPLNTPIQVSGFIQPPVATATPDLSPEAVALYEQRLNKIIDERLKVAQQQQYQAKEEERAAAEAAARPPARMAGSKRSASRAPEPEEEEAAVPVAPAPTQNAEYAALLKKNQELEAQLTAAKAAAAPAKTASVPVEDDEDDFEIEEVDLDIEVPAVAAETVEDDDDPNKEAPLLPVGPSQKTMNKLKEQKESVLALKRTIKSLKEKLKDPNMSDNDKREQLNEINTRSKACQELSAKFLTDVQAVVSSTYMNGGKQTPSIITKEFADWVTKPEITVGVLNQADKYLQMVSASSGAAQQTLATVQNRMKKLKSENEFHKMQLREKQDLLSRNSEHAAAARAARAADPKSSAAEMQKRAVDAQSHLPTQVPVPATPTNALTAMFADVLSFKSKNPVPIGQSGSYAGYDAATSLPIGKKDEELTIAEITGIPMTLADANVSVITAAANHGLREGFRQAPQISLLSSDSVATHGATQGLRVLKGAQRTGNTEFLAAVTPNLLRAGTAALDLRETGTKIPKNIPGGKTMTNADGVKYIIMSSASSTLVPKNFDWLNE